MGRHGAFEVGYVFHGNYRVVRVLGRGGMGIVLEVEHTRLPRRLALKVLTAPVSAANDDMLRFRSEAETLASLNHPNLVVVFDWNVTEDERLPYLVMELLSGEDLAQVLKRRGALPQHVAISIFAQTINALEVVHSHGIVHRDLKPANLFLCKNGVIPHFIKVLDFGIAKCSRPGSALVTNNLVLMGTPAYMAPEQARGDLGPVGPRTDQFALGLVLYEMLSGRPAFYRSGEPAMSTLFRVMHEEPEPLADAAMNAVVMRALRKSPDERYQSLADFLRVVLAAASVPVEAIEIPEHTEKLAVRPVGVAGSESEVRAGDASEGGAPAARSAQGVASPGGGSRPGRSVVALLPLPGALSSVPIVVPAALHTGPESPVSKPAAAGPAEKPGVTATTPGATAGQTLPVRRVGRLKWRAALVLLPLLLAALAAPGERSVWVVGHLRSAASSPPAKPAEADLGLVPLDGGSVPDAASVADLGLSLPPSLDLGYSAPRPDGGTPAPAKAEPAPPARCASRAAPRYPLKFQNLVAVTPADKHAVECAEQHISREDRQALSRVSPMELCWTARSSWRLVTSAWINKFKSRVVLEHCLNGILQQPENETACFFVGAEEERRPCPH